MNRDHSDRSSLNDVVTGTTMDAPISDEMIARLNMRAELLEVHAKLQEELIAREALLGQSAAPCRSGETADL